MGRPSPRTQGVDEEGKTFQKFGTQQLSFAAGTPPKLGTPYQGVVEKNFGDVNWFNQFYGGTKSTVFSERFQAGITGATPTALRETAIQRQKEKLEEWDYLKLKFQHGRNCFLQNPLTNMDASVKLARMELDNVQIKMKNVTHGILDAR
jgi:hypothetical protein